MNEALNRTQRRAMHKGRTTRARKMTPRQMQAYQDRARLWAKGCKATGRHIDGEFEGEWAFPAHVPNERREAVADYATHAPLRWRCVARLVLRYDDGSRDVRECEAELGQVQLIGELQELRDELMRDLKAKANCRYVWDEIFEMECLG